MNDFITGMDEACHPWRQDMAGSIDYVFEDSLNYVEDLQRSVGMRDRLSACLEDHLADFDITLTKVAFIKQDAQNSPARGNVARDG